jgi:hypothetical protein
MLPDDLRLQVLSPLSSDAGQAKGFPEGCDHLARSVDDKEDWEQATINSLV